MFYLVCYLRHADRVFETYWTTLRGVEAMDYSYGLLDMTVYGRQEAWEDSPVGWPQRWDVNGEQVPTNGRPTAQWSRLEAGSPACSVFSGEAKASNSARPESRRAVANPWNRYADASVFQEAELS